MEYMAKANCGVASSFLIDGSHRVIEMLFISSQSIHAHYLV